MNTKKGASLSAAAARIIRIIIYCIFIGYSIIQVYNASTFSARITYVIIAIAAIAGTAYYEVLQYNYEKAIYFLNYKCDPEAASAVYDHLQKLDFAGGFRSRRVIFDVLTDLSLYRAEEAVQLIENNDKIFRGTLDQLLIRNVSLFLAYVYAGNRSAARRAYPEAVKLKKVKIRGRKLAALYNWDELEALHYLVENDWRKAAASYRSVKPQYMNNRELSQYYYYYAVCMKQSGNMSEAEDLIQKLYTIAEKLPVKEKAEALLR
jgi:hypothetical protein